MEAVEAVEEKRRTEGEEEGEDEWELKRQEAEGKDVALRQRC